MAREISQDEFRTAMSQLTGAVSIVATGAAARYAEWRGMTATAVCSLCAEPPSLVVCLNRHTGTYQRARQVGAFSVNVLASEHVALAQTFAGYDGLVGPARFTGTDWAPGVLDVPVLAGALATYECRIARAVEHGTHALLIGAIEAASWQDRDAEPLVHQRQRFRDLGRELKLTGGANT
jgi:flavin reductase (DIM6/NTAB) family NADH-FMN oxidoreductase RutF